MTKEEKEILTKDLCSRLMHKVMVSFDGDGDIPRELTSFDNDADGGYFSAESFSGLKVDESSLRPYLRPLMSMKIKDVDDLSKYSGFHLTYDIPGKWETVYTVRADAYKLFEWLDIHMFDYRYLIDKDLAIEAPEGMYKFDD